MGRPSSFTQETADAICSRLANGESLRGICEEDGMPSESTVRSWAIDNIGGTFSAQYARARDLQADALAEEIVTISDEPPEVVTRDGENKDVSLDSGFVARQRLRVDARKWFASKVAPKRYGDKLDLEHTGKDGGPIENKVTVEFVGTAP